MVIRDLGMPHRRDSTKCRSVSIMIGKLVQSRAVLTHMNNLPSRLMVIINTGMLKIQGS